MITQQIQNELQTDINRSLPYAAYMYWCNVPIRDGQLGLIRQITWHQNLNSLRRSLDSIMIELFGVS